MFNLFDECWLRAFNRSGFTAITFVDERAFHADFQVFPFGLLAFDKDFRAAAGNLNLVGLAVFTLEEQTTSAPLRGCQFGGTL